MEITYLKHLVMSRQVPEIKHPIRSKTIQNTEATQNFLFILNLNDFSTHRTFKNKII